MGALPVHETGMSETAALPGFKYLKSAENKPEAPAVSFADKDGKDVGLDQFKGRVVVLNLWATWCGPCVTELPALAKLKAALPEDRFAVVAVDMEKNDAAKVSDFLAMHDASGLTVFVDRQLMLMRSFTAYALPLTVIIDPTGHEIARAVGPEAWDDPKAVGYIKSLANKS
jgi:thiol-disulfide isomerase/thioredoxin